MYPLFCACTSTNLSVDFLIPALNSPESEAFEYSCHVQTYINCATLHFFVFFCSWRGVCFLFWHYFLLHRAHEYVCNMDAELELPEE